MKQTQRLGTLRANPWRNLLSSAAISVALSVALAACSSIPGTGPRTADIVDGAKAAGPQGTIPYVLIDLDQNAAQAVGEAAAAIHPSLLVAFGERARSIAEGARAKGLPESVTILVTDKNDPAAAVEAVQARLQPNDLVLVKGSRGMQMERISDPLAGVAPPSAGGAH